MGEGKKTVGERKPFPRLLGASAWHLISRWELLTFRWPTCHRRREGGIWYLRFRLSSRGRDDERGGRAQWIAWITSEYLIIQLTCWQTWGGGGGGRFTAISPIVFHRGRDGWIYPLAVINWAGYACYCSISRSTEKLCPDWYMPATIESQLGTLGLFRWKESKGEGEGVNNSIGVSHVLGSRVVWFSVGGEFEGKVVRSTFFFLEIEINVFYDFVNCAQLEETSLASFVRILDYQKMKIFSKLLKYLISEACIIIPSVNFFYFYYCDID